MRKILCLLCLAAVCVAAAYAAFMLWAQSLLSPFSENVWKCSYHSGARITLVELVHEDGCPLLEREARSETERLDYALNDYVSLSFIITLPEEEEYMYVVQKQMVVAGLRINIGSAEQQYCGYIIE